MEDRRKNRFDQRNYDLLPDETTARMLAPTSERRKDSEMRDWFNGIVFTVLGAGPSDSLVLQVGLRAGLHYRGDRRVDS